MEVLLDKLGLRHKNQVKSIMDLIFDLIDKKFAEGQTVTFNAQNSNLHGTLAKIISECNKLIAKYGAEKVKDLIQFKNCPGSVQKNFDGLFGYVQ